MCRNLNIHRHIQYFAAFTTRTNIWYVTPLKPCAYEIFCVPFYGHVSTLFSFSCANDMSKTNSSVFDLLKIQYWVYSNNNNDTRNRQKQIIRLHHQHPTRLESPFSMLVCVWVGVCRFLFAWLSAGLWDSNSMFAYQKARTSKNKKNVRILTGAGAGNGKFSWLGVWKARSVVSIINSLNSFFIWQLH